MIGSNAKAEIEYVFQVLRRHAIWRRPGNRGTSIAHLLNRSTEIKWVKDASKGRFGQNGKRFTVMVMVEGQ